MWKLYSITAEHIAAIEQITYTLQQGVTTLIFGRNLDNDSQGSNGSGKSALLESISLAITGDTLRHVKMDEIINDRHDTARVYAELINIDRHERLTIERTLSRKAPQAVTCQHYVYDEQVDCTQANVSDYNEFICQTIGISKEDLFNNFILSKHKYKSFLASSDKDKKEIINRISNAVLVDEAIAKLDEDIVPVQDESRQAELNIASANAAINAIQEQIDKANEDLAAQSQNRIQRIKELKDKVAAKRKENRELQEHIDSINEGMLGLADLVDQVQAIEDDTSIGFLDCYEQIKDLLNSHNINGFSDWKVSIQECDLQLREIEAKAQCSMESIGQFKKEMDDYIQKNGYTEIYDKQISKYDEDIDQITQDNASNLAELKSISVNITQTTARLEQINERLAQLKNSIAGTIECPKCSHQFVFGSQVDVTATKKLIVQTTAKMNVVKEELEALNAKGDAINQSVKKLREKANNISQRRSECMVQKNSIQKTIKEYQDRLFKMNQEFEDLQHQIAKNAKEMERCGDSMFDEALDLIQMEITTRTAAVNKMKVEIETNTVIQETAQNTIKELESAVDDNSLIQNLKSSLQTNQEKLKKAMDEASRVNLELESLNLQKARFVEFKTYLANTKIEALNQVTNDFLERIGSDIRIQFSGYTVLKSGKVRDKISISLVRNGVDGGSFDKFSEGEKARVNLANILAMNALANSNSEAGRGLDLLILDEILEATDEDGLANIFQAINNLGITALVVSHGNVAENYPYRLVVNKRNGVSFINE